MDRFALILNDHTHLLFEFLPLREASKNFELLTFPGFTDTFFSTRHFSIAILSLKVLTDIAKSRLARYVRHLILDFHPGKALPQAAPRIKPLRKGTSSPHTLNDGGLFLEIFAKGNYLRNVLLESALLQTSLRKFSSLETIKIDVPYQTTVVLSNMALMDRDPISEPATEHVKILLEAIVLSDCPLETLSLFSLDSADLGRHQNPLIWFNSFALSYPDLGNGVRKVPKAFENLRTLELTMGCGLLCDECPRRWDSTAGVNAFVRTIAGLPQLDTLVLRLADSQADLIDDQTGAGFKRQLVRRLYAPNLHTLSLAHVSGVPAKTVAIMLGRHYNLRDLRLQNIDLHYSDYVNWRPVFEELRDANNLDQVLFEDLHWTTEMGISRGVCLEGRCRKTTRTYPGPCAHNRVGLDGKKKVQELLVRLMEDTGGVLNPTKRNSRPSIA